jgi:hypothetical protein
MAQPSKPQDPGASDAGTERVKPRPATPLFQMWDRPGIPGMRPQGEAKRFRHAVVTFGTTSVLPNVAIGRYAGAVSSPSRTKRLPGVSKGFFTDFRSRVSERGEHASRDRTTAIEHILSLLSIWTGWTSTHYRRQALANPEIPEEPKYGMRVSPVRYLVRRLHRAELTAHR